LFFWFLHHKGKERLEKLKKILQSDKISILYESPHRIEKLLKELKELEPERVIFLAKEISKMHETFIKGKAKEIKLSNTKGEWVVVIDKTQTPKKSELTFEDILELNLPLKEKSKLLSKISKKSAKEIYQELLG